MSLSSGQVYSSFLAQRHISHPCPGEKIVPVDQEAFLGSLPFVNGAIMFGRGRNQAGLLIEPRAEDVINPKDENAIIAFRNKIWYGHSGRMVTKILDFRY